MNEGDRDRLGHRLCSDVVDWAHKFDLRAHFGCETLLAKYWRDAVAPVPVMDDILLEDVKRTPGAVYDTFTLPHAPGTYRYPLFVRGEYPEVAFGAWLLKKVDSMHRLVVGYYDTDQVGNRYELLATSPLRMNLWYDAGDVACKLSVDYVFRPRDSVQ